MPTQRLAVCLSPSMQVLQLWKLWLSAWHQWRKNTRVVRDHHKFQDCIDWRSYTQGQQSLSFWESKQFSSSTCVPFGTMLTYMKADLPTVFCTTWHLLWKPPHRHTESGGGQGKLEALVFYTFPSAEPESQRSVFCCSCICFKNFLLNQELLL